ncbi:TRAP transporter substrate-binding protein DctP [Treponema parvum]|uniref:TRAP transporter substrate-binding protein DctP n=1 Tax=Treponema parvum TaxID=138851 RepID=A0A975F250_9SPIR|nr:TRAP transporter substrate-binding protein DctP [Treponema parvum]QTQ12993.1 TRAP transporter substrate-binding protein DctP [Treponema parvum]
MKKAVMGFFVTVLITTALFAQGGVDGTNKKSGKVYEIKLVTSNGSEDINVKMFKKYAGIIKEKTNGNVDIQIYPGGEILMGDEGIEAVMANAAVISFNDLDVMADYVPEFSSVCAAFLWDGATTMENFAKTETYDKLIRIGDKKGVHVIAGTFCVGSRNIFAGGTEVYDVADAAKLNIRIPNVSSYVDTFNAFGANYSAISWSAGVTACETGMLNGAECTVQRAAVSGLAQILKNPVYSMIKWRNAMVGLYCGAGFWNTLPIEYRTIITEEFTKCAHETNKMIEAEEDGYLQSLKNQGVKIIPYEDINIESFKTAARSVNEKFPMFSEVSLAVGKIQSSK